MGIGVGRRDRACMVALMEMVLPLPERVMGGGKLCERGSVMSLAGFLSGGIRGSENKWVVDGRGLTRRSIINDSSLPRDLQSCISLP